MELLWRMPREYVEESGHYLKNKVHSKTGKGILKLVACNEGKKPINSSNVWKGVYHCSKCAEDYCYKCGLGRQDQPCVPLITTDEPEEEPLTGLCNKGHEMKALVIQPLKYTQSNKQVKCNDCSKPIPIITDGFLHCDICNEDYCNEHS